MWSSEDVAWLVHNYPGMRQIDAKVIEGNLNFRMLRLGVQYFVNPSEEQVLKIDDPDYIYICDVYAIRICWDDSFPYPMAYEIGGKLAAVANTLGKDLRDMHLFPKGGALCLASPMDLIIKLHEHFDLSKYIEEYLIPYLFAQSYYAKKQTWIWGELSHGYFGLLEWLGRQKEFTDQDAIITHQVLTAYNSAADISKLVSVRCRNHKPCLCGSGKKTRNCHPDMQNGISRIRGAISRGTLKI